MGGGGGGLRGGLGLAFGADGVHRFQIDDVAQQDLALVQLVAPHGERFEGQRAFAQRADHQLAAGLDALGDGDFAFAGEELDAAHLAQIHAHRIVGAVVLLGGGAGLGDDFLAALGDGGGDCRRRLLPVPRTSMTLMPISLSIDIVSSICSDETLSEGSTLFSSS